MAYRYWCGECGYRTPWLGESRAQELQIEHYAKRHPDVPPGGSVETNRKKPGEGPGCLATLGVVILLLVLAASCHR
ncbi:hypothetical protein F7Q99_33015 [Streptomyces kaniharaensis]|uniref:Uncharacterized protein n=1 Tax=Streptomyces kaniharaensis TaxID=212423 RepID=A0A6N7KZQ0_9ACTN|nr:hypothetical protein [Streptomyces kaniharaensis]MQS16881.1 hypothetical protein [Streptomyces kaniharaensis]